VFNEDQKSEQLGAERALSERKEEKSGWCRIQKGLNPGLSKFEKAIDDEPA